MIKILMYHGANVNSIKEKNGYTPLHVAVEGGQFEICKYLIAHGAIVNKRTKDGLSSYDLALINGHLVIVKFFSQNNYWHHN